MSSSSNQKSLLIILSVALIVVSSTFLISIFARGYRLDTSSGFQLKVTGLLSVSSKPKLASVYVNNLLTTATDDTLNLAPGNYQIKITKDGYHSWEKNIQIKPELVNQIEAQLFRSSTELKPLTEHQIINPISSPDATKIVYAVASSSAKNKENGLYLMELTELPLLMSRNSERLLFPNNSIIDWTKFNFEFSPDSKQILASAIDNSSIYLISLDQNQNINNLSDISSRLAQIKKEWQIDKEKIIKDKLVKIPLEIHSFIATNSALLSFNASEDKFVYQAAQNGQITNLLLSPPPTQSTQFQQRNLIKDSYYVYDLKEDTNFLIGDSFLSQISWIPYSNNLLFIQNNQVQICDYDATNYKTIYSNSTSPELLLSTPDGYRLIISWDTLHSITIKDR
jgi:hypothetical protein